MSNSETAIVLGATGLVGAALVECLVESPEVSSIRTLTRRAVSHESSKVQNVVVDFEQLEKAHASFHGKWLFSCLGTTRKQAGSLKAQYRVDYHYQLEAAKLAMQAGVSHYLLVSSSGADAASPFDYLKMKGALEAEVQKLHFERLDILQPSLLLGQRAQARLGEGFASLVLPILCRLPGLKKYRPISAQQVAQKMLQLALKSQHQGCKVHRLDQLFD